MEASSKNETEEISELTVRVLQAAKIFNHFYIPLLCLFGALGNCLSVSVFCKPSLHRSLSSSLYLSAVAISDTGFLLSLIAVWLEDMGVPVITTSVTCPLVMYLGQVTCFLSVWFIVAFTIERFFAVCYPLTRPTICTVARAKKGVAILTVLALMGFSYVWVIATVVKYPAQHDVNVPLGPCDLVQNDCDLFSDKWINFNSSSNLQRFNHQTEDAPPPIPTKTVSFCSVRQEHLHFSGIASQIDSVLTLILPFGIIAYLNIRIAACVWRFRVQRENLVAAAGKGRKSDENDSELSHCRGQVSFIYRSKQFGCADINPHKFNAHNQMLAPCQQPFRERVNLVDFEPSHSKSTTNNNSPNYGVDNSVKKPSESVHKPIRKVRANGSGYAKAEARVTKTLLLVSTVFLVLNLPSHAIRAVSFIQFVWKINISPDALFAAQQWANVLFNMNFSVNFLLYCVSGRNFRVSIKRILFRKSRHRRQTKNKIVESLLIIDHNRPQFEN